MPLIVLLILATAAGAAAYVAARHLQRHGATPVVPRGLDEARRHPRLRGALDARLDPAAATGLALSVAIVVLLVGGLVVGALALSLHTSPTFLGLDARISSWAHDHATTLSTDGLKAVTQLGATVTVIVLAIALAIAETRRTRSRWVAPFLLLVLAGEHLLSTLIKDLVDRARPTLNPAASTLGPSFPSGHTTAAAAFYAAAALLLSRGRPRRTRAVLAGTAVAIAVGVAASRVLLDVHWVTDVIGGLALGWSWFAVCAIAFGGRLLRFGATAEAVQGDAGRSRSPDDAPVPLRVE